MFWLPDEASPSLMRESDRRLTCAIDNSELLSYFQTQVIIPIIPRGIPLHLLPHPTRPLRNPIFQRPLLNRLQRLLKLSDMPRSNHNPIPLPQRTVIHNPSISQRRLPNPGIPRNHAPIIQPVIQRGFAVKLVVHVPKESLLAETTLGFVGSQLRGRLGEETASDG